MTEQLHEIGGTAQFGQVTITDDGKLTVVCEAMTSLLGLPVPLPLVIGALVVDESGSDADHRALVLKVLVPLFELDEGEVSDGA